MIRKLKKKRKEGREKVEQRKGRDRTKGKGEETRRENEGPDLRERKGKIWKSIKGGREGDGKGR